MSRQTSTKKEKEEGRDSVQREDSRIDKMHNLHIQYT